MAKAGGFELVLGLAPQKIADAAVNVRCIAGDAEQPPPSPSVSVQTVPRTPRRCVIRCGMPRSGTTTPCAKRTASGNRPSRAAIQPPCFCANSRASFKVPRGGIVRITSRVAAWMRKV